MPHRSQRGFSLLEVVIATALTAFVIVAAATAVARALHGTALVEKKVAMRADALNVLADLRAVTAYDRDALQRMVGKTATMRIDRSAADVETIDVRVSAEPNALPNGTPPAAGVAPATVTVAEATVTELGETITERQVLYNEAPAPGSAVNQ